MFAQSDVELQFDLACARAYRGSQQGEGFRNHLCQLGLLRQEIDVEVPVRGVGGRSKRTKAYRWPEGLMGRTGQISLTEIPSHRHPLLMAQYLASRAARLT